MIAFLLATNPLVAQAAGFITSSDIVNNTIKSKDVKDKGLKGKDLKDNTVTGAQVDEASLGTVTNATNATNLNGLAASSYQNQSYRFRLTGAAASDTKTWTFPGIPAGNYTFQYSVVGVSGDDDLRCYMLTSATATLSEGLQYAAYLSPFLTANGGGALQLTATAPALTCNSGGTFSISTDADFPSTVTLTKVDSLTSATAAGREGTARSTGPGSR